MHCQRCPETPEFRSRIRIFAREFVISRGVPFDAADNRLRRKFRRPNALDYENEVPKAASSGTGSTIQRRAIPSCAGPDLFRPDRAAA